MAGKRGLAKLRKMVVKLKTCMQLLRIKPVLSYEELTSEKEESSAATVCEPKGHFTVLAGDRGEEQQRFVLELKYLQSPAVLKLLKKAEEEYGSSFRHEGALVVPCRPQELQSI